MAFASLLTQETVQLTLLELPILLFSFQPISPLTEKTEERGSANITYTKINTRPPILEYRELCQHIFYRNIGGLPEKVEEKGNLLHQNKIQYLRNQWQIDSISLWQVFISCQRQHEETKRWYSPRQRIPAVRSSSLWLSRLLLCRPHNGTNLFWLRF